MTEGDQSQPNNLEKDIARFGWLLKNWKVKELIYSGNTDLASETISPRDAVIRYGPNSAFMRLFEFPCFGEPVKFHFPIFDQEEISPNAKNITADFVDFISYMASNKILKEKNFTVWKGILKEYELREEERPSPLPPLHYFRTTTVKSTAPIGLGQVESLQEMKELCAKKEFLDGLIKFRPVKIKGKVIEQPYENIQLPTQNTTVFGSYTTALRYMLFKDTRYYNKIKPGETLQPRQWTAKLHEGWITAVIAPRRGGKCLTSGTSVRLYGDIYKKARDIKVGDLLHGTHGPVKVINTELGRKRCVRVTLQNGMSKEVTYDHHCPTQINFNNNQWDMNIDLYKNAEKLTQKDFLPCIFNIDNGSIKGTFEDGLLLGYILGDGGFNGESSLIHINNKESQKYLIEKCGKDNFIKHKKYLYLKRSIGKVYKELYGVGCLSYEKHINNEVFTSSNKFKRGVVNGMIATDGYLGASKGGVKGDGYVRIGKTWIEYCSVSKSLIDGMQLLLMELGIYSKKYKKPIKSNFKSRVEYAWYITITENESLKKIIKNCELHFKKNYEQFIENISHIGYTNSNTNIIPVRARKEAIGGTVIGKRRMRGDMRMPENNFQRWKAEKLGLNHWLKYSWSKVETVEDIGEQDIVSIEVDGDRIYTADGIFTHNTYYATSRIIEEFTRDKQHADKPVRVIFIGINRKKNKTVINYILAMSQDLLRHGYFDWNASEQIMYYREKGATKQQDRTLGIIEFIGARDEDAGVGDSADLIVIDECERIPKNVWEDVFPIITNEGAKCLLISTLNKRSEKSWFYNVIVKGEQEELKRSLVSESPREVINDIWNRYVQPHIDGGEPYTKWIHRIDVDAIKKEMMIRRMRVGIRFTGEDIDYWTEQERGIARNALRENPTAYYPERWGIFPEDIKTYDFESSIKPPEYFYNKLYKYVVVAYDPAESRDKAAVVFLGWNEAEKKIEVIKISKLPSNYTFHGPYIKDALREAQKYIIPQGIRDPSNSVYFAYDHNGVGHGLEPYFTEVGIRIDLKIKFTGQGTPQKKGSLHTVPKQFLVSITQNVFEHGSVSINQECIDLIEEMENYKGITNDQTGNTKYKASTGSDDFVSAMMIGMYFILEYMGEKYKIGKNEIEQLLEDNENNGSLTDEQRNRLYIAELRKGRTIADIKKQHDPGSQLSLRRRDLLSKFGY